MARVGVITGSGTYALPALADAREERVHTPYGEVTLSRGGLAGVEVVHLSRHGPGHRRLSNHVTHRANIAALDELGVECVLAFSVAGAVDPSIGLGELVVFDDLHFPSNRLPDGSLCTYFTEPGDPSRAHWIYERPFADGARHALLEAARRAGQPVRDGGCYGHVDGPRFNTAAEIRGLAACGVTAVSQTAGPETVLAGELGLPYGLMAYVTDYANGVKDEPTPVEELLRLMSRSAEAFSAVLPQALPVLAEAELRPPGIVYRMEQGTAKTE
jgi:5'-methylthioadenosine phosphorylase